MASAAASSSLAPLPMDIEGSMTPAPGPTSSPSGSGSGISCVGISSTGPGAVVTPGAPGLTAPTLDEPVATTIMRDLRQVGTKLRYVLLPAGRQSDTLKELRNWDLWGPLLLCLTLSILLSVSAPLGQASLVFASVFVIVWAGAAVVTVNAQLLGGQISFFQSVCVLGYCIFPLVLASMLAAAWSNPLWRSILVVVALVWSTRASVVFMGEMVSPVRRALAVYPTLLFYVIIGWLVFVQ